MKRALFVPLVIAFGLSCVTVLRITAAETEAPPASPATATPTPPPSAPAKRSAAELEKLVMPIALHPDQLIAVILPASVYPLEIVQAARFVKDTNNIPKVDDQDWDDNVKALAKFPDMLKKMDADLGWTVELGQAFLEQSKELMDTIQSLRGKAQKAGTLQTTPQQVVTVTNVVVLQTNFTQVVTVTNEVVRIIPSNPEVVYVPTYPPAVYYPPPAYVYNPVAPLVTFGVGMAWGAILANNCNWGHGDVDINVNNSRNSNINSSRNVNNSRTSGVSGGNRAATTQKWQPNQSRMRTSGAGGASASTREARGWGSGNAGARPSTGNVGARPSTGNAGARPSTGNVGARPSTGNVGARPSTGNVGARPSTGSGSRPAASPSTSQARSSPSGGRSSGSAFSGSSSGSSARNASSRGSSSRGGGGFSGGGRGGGGRGGGGGRR